jgi:predicted aminopeptidase
MAPGVMGRIFSRGLLLALMLLLGACAETAYYWQSIGGHLRLMQSARPIRDWLDDVQTAPALRRTPASGATDAPLRQQPVASA